MILALYIFIVLYWYAIPDKNSNTINRYLTLTALLIWLLMGLRNQAIYGDTLSYIDDFRSLNEMSYREVAITYFKDPFFYLAAKFLFPIIGGSYTIWLLLIGAVYMIPLTIILRRYSTDPMLSWISFIFVGLFMFVMAALRQTVAMGFIMLGFLCLMDGKSLKFLLCVLAAGLFHSTALIFLLVYPIVKFEIPFNGYAIIIYVVLTLGMLTAGKVFLSTVTSYLSDYDMRFQSYGENMKGATYTYLIQQLLLVVPSLLVLRNRLYGSVVPIFMHLAFIGIVFVAASTTVAEMFRLSMFFSWADIILFAYAVTIVQSERGNLIPISALILMTLYGVFINKSLMTPYFFWFEDTADFIRMNYFWLP